MCSADPTLDVLLAIILRAWVQTLGALVVDSFHAADSERFRSMSLCKDL